MQWGISDDIEYVFDAFIVIVRDGNGIQAQSELMPEEDSVEQISICSKRDLESGGKRN